MARLLPALSLLLLVSCSAALECYQCTGCEEGQRGHPIECSSSQDACLKVVLGTRIEKSCTHTSACQLGKVEKSITGVFKDLSSSITGEDRDDSNEAQVIHCCDSDYCNSAVTAAPAAALLLPLLLSALLR